MVVGASLCELRASGLSTAQIMVERVSWPVPNILTSHKMPCVFKFVVHLLFMDGYHGWIPTYFRVEFDCICQIMTLPPCFTDVMLECSVWFSPKTTLLKHVLS